MTGRRLRQPEHGAALLIFMILLVMGAMTYLVNNLTPEAIEARRAQKTGAALAQARDALIGYALKYRDVQAAKDADSTGEDDRAMYGYLPLPDLGSSRNQNIDTVCKDAGNNPIEGCDANTFTGIAFDTHGIGPSVVGRFPWRTLGTAPLRDGDGECLWLIVSSLHSRIQRSSPPAVLPPMNWDTLGQLDILVANGSSALVSALANAHERPVAIIFSPGPPLPGQDRSPSATDDVRQCGGNYNAANYLDPAIATALGGAANYLGGTNAASGSTGDSDPGNDPDTPKGVVTQGKVYASGAAFLPASCQGGDCSLVANDAGLRIASDTLFGAIRKNAYFRNDINALLDRMAGCLRDEIAAGSGPTGYAKIAGADGNACYGADVAPLGYYPHYREMIFVAKPAGTASVTVDGTSQAGCAGALLFAGQRGTGQQRITAIEKNTPANYLEGINLANFTGNGGSFAGAGQLGRVTASQTNPADLARCTSGGNWVVSASCHTAEQDVVRCIPNSASLNQVVSPALDALGGQLTSYDAANRTLTLGRLYAITSSQRNANARAFFGCSWVPETHLLGGGLRSYFKFRILNTGEGFTFAIVDGDRNTANACGAARQHLGYSGNNGVTPFIAYPKIGIEIDTTRHAGFNPASSNTLNNGRNDPSYTGGHVGIAYWGGAAPIPAGACSSSCKAPRYCNAGICYLPQEEDDNVHGLPTPPDPSPRPAPRNPPAPASPTLSAGVYKLDPSLSQIPVNQDIHVRIELTRTATDAAAHGNTYLLEAWVLKDSLTDANLIAAMENTTRPMSQLAAGFAAHLRDTPTIYDLQGGSCAGGLSCAGGQTCGDDNMCYAEVFRNARLGFTTSQSTAANDQIISISDIFTSWIP